MLPALVTNQTMQFIQNCEGLRLRAYQDSRGIWTIGYGQTRIRGRAVRKGDTMTRAEAEGDFRVTVQYFQNHVLAMIKPTVRSKLTLNQLTALVSLAYNIGLDEDDDLIAEGFGDSTLLKKLNSGDFKGCANEFPQWKRAGKDKDILLSRRLKEQKLFLS